MKKNKSGVTLIELLIAMSVFGVVIMAGYSIFNSLTTEMKGSIGRADTRKSARNIIEQITKDIQEAKDIEEGYKFIQINGDEIRYYYDLTTSRLIREVNGNRNIAYEDVAQPFIIEQAKQDLFKITLNMKGSNRIIETNEIYVSTIVGKDIVTPLPPSDNKEIQSNFALITPKSIFISGSAFINGDIATQNGRLTMQSASINGNVYTGGTPNFDIRYSTITGEYPIIDTTIKYSYSLPVIHDAPHIENRIEGETKFDWYPLPNPVTESAYYEKLTINNYMEVDVSKGDIIIHTKTLRISGGSQKNGDKIILNGNGKCYIYVDEDININGVNYINRGGYTNQLYIISKSKDFNLGGACTLNGNVYVKAGNLAITGSASIVGNCIVGGNKVEITGGGVAMDGAILAPYADVIISGSRVINGWVIAGGDASLSGGNTQINYAPVVLHIP